MLQWTGIVSIL